MNGIVRFPPVTEGTEDDRRVRARFAALKEFELLHSSSPRCKDKNQDQESFCDGASPRPRPLLLQTATALTRSRCWCWEGCGCAATSYRCSSGIYDGSKISPAAQCFA